MSEANDGNGCGADGVVELSDSSKNVLNVIRYCWGPLNKSYIEQTLIANRGLRYTPSRDMANVLCAVLPAAAEFAATARPDLAEAEGPLADIAGKYAACLTARDHGLDVLADGFSSLLEDRDRSEAFVLFSASFTLNMLVYMLCVPHLADSIGDLHPDMVSKALAGISRGAGWDVTESKMNPVNWVKRWMRRHALSKLISSGTLPNAPWVTDFVHQKGAGLVRGLIQQLIDDGGVIEDVIETNLSDGALLPVLDDEKPTVDAKPEPETEG